MDVVIPLAISNRIHIVIQLLYLINVMFVEMVFERLQKLVKIMINLTQMVACKIVQESFQLGFAQEEQIQLLTFVFLNTVME